MPPSIPFRGGGLRRLALAALLAAALPAAAQEPQEVAAQEPQEAAAQEPQERGPWVQIAAEDGVRVEQSDSTTGGLPRFRGSTEIEADLYDVLPVILDDSRHTQWMPGCLESRLLRHDGPAANYVYSRSDLPWPLADRDAVLRSRVVMVRPGVEVAALFDNAEDASMPPVRGAVRVPLLRGGFRFEALGPGLTRVELEVEMDPGGRIPRFVLPIAGRTHAIDTLGALREQVRATRGEYAEFMREFLARGEYEQPEPQSSDAPAPGL